MTGRKANTAWLLIDQASFAIGNFAVNILCARWLDPASYGLFALSFSFYILLTVLHWGTVIEPLLVLAPRVEHARQHAYLSTSLRWHIAEALLLMALAALAVLSGWAGCGPTAWCVCASFLGAATMLGLTSARRLCLVFLSARASALAGLIYMVATLLTAAMVYVLGVISWWTVWVVMGCWSLLCTFALGWLMASRAGRGRPFDSREFAAEHGAFARWGIAAACASWIRSDGAYLVLANSVGLAAVAETRAMLTLCAPALQLNSALNATWLVGFSRAAADGNDALRQVYARLLPYAVLMAVGIAGAVLFGRQIATVVFQGRYNGSSWTLPVFAAVMTLNGAETLLSSALKSWGLRREGYVPQFVGAAVTGLSALVTVPFFGIEGLVLAMVAGSLAGLAVGVASCMALPARKRRLGITP